MPFSYIKTHDELSPILQDLKDQDFVCFDFEFIRRNTYFPILSLVQLSYCGRTYVIDMIDTELNLKFLEPFFRSDVVKVVHAGKQDVEIIYLALGFIPENIFDTQVASMFCGFKEQISYKDLVHEFTGVELSKSEQDSNWQARPLLEKQIAYAAADVIYLREVYQGILERLEENTENAKASEMAKAACIEFFDESKFKINTNDAWQRLNIPDFIKDPHIKYKIINIAKWREEICIKLDIVRNAVIRDKELIALALSEMGIKNAISRGTSLEVEDLNALKLIIETDINENDPEYKSHIEFISANSSRPKLTEKQKELYELLNMIIKREVKKYNLSISAVAPKRVMLEMVQNPGDISNRVLNGWRGIICKKPIEDFLNGKTAISYQNDKIDLNHL